MDLDGDDDDFLTQARQSSWGIAGLSGPGGVLLTHIAAFALSGHPLEGWRVDRPSPYLLGAGSGS